MDDSIRQIQFEYHRPAVAGKSMFRLDLGCANPLDHNGVHATGASTLALTIGFSVLSDRSELIAVSSYARRALNPGVIERQQHERFIGHLPLTPDAVTTCWNEAEAGIVLPMPDNDDEGAATLSKSLGSLSNQPRSDAHSLELW
jgi:hypothetical protein